MNIQHETDPERYGVWFPRQNTQVICQLMEDALEGPDRIVIGEARVSTRAKAKLKIHESMPLQEFLDGYAPIGTRDLEKAFEQYIREKFPRRKTE